MCICWDSSSSIKYMQCHTYTHVCIHTYIHTYMHTHTFIHTCTFILPKKAVHVWRSYEVVWHCNITHAASRYVNPQVEVSTCRSDLYLSDASGDCVARHLQLHCQQDAENRGWVNRRHWRMNRLQVAELHQQPASVTLTGCDNTLATCWIKSPLAKWSRHWLNKAATC